MYNIKSAVIAAAEHAYNTNILCRLLFYNSHRTGFFLYIGLKDVYLVTQYTNEILKNLPGFSFLKNK